MSAPLSDSPPLGSDVRNDPAFEEIEAEVRRIETEGPAAIRWDRIAAGGIDLMTHRGRDLLLVVWTIYALVQSERWRGLAVGLSALRPMICDWWEAIVPRRDRARIGAIEWLVGRVSPLVAQLDVTQEDAAAILHASQILEDLQSLLPERLPNNEVAIGELVRVVRAKAAEARELMAREEEASARAAAPPPEPEPPATPVREVAVAPRPAAPVAPPAVPVASPTVRLDAPPQIGSGLDAAELDRSVSALAASMRQHAAGLREANLADPRSYRLVRTAAWLDIQLLPPARSGQTVLPPPQVQRMQTVEALRQAGTHDELVRTLEGMVSSSPFWLDAHRLVCDALSALGPNFVPAAQGVVELTVAFIRRLPALVDLTFGDGTPFADAQTRDWLARHAPSGQSVALAPAAATSEIADEVRELIAAGNRTEAIERLAGAHATARGERQAFDVQTLQAEVCLEFGLPTVAIPLALHLQSVADSRNLESWEPELALKAAGLAMKVLRHPSAETVLGGEGLRAAVAATQARLSRLDVRAATRLALV
ncbi:type VI secretion system protein TssA [Xanthobacteraceae bacterium A53D]